MSAAVTVFKNNALEMERLAEEQDRAKARAAEEQRQALCTAWPICSEASVGGIVSSVANAATDMQNSARSLSSTAEETSKRAIAVSAAAAETTSSVQSVAAAAEELAASITEIGRQVTHSTQIAGDAVAGVDKTNSTGEEPRARSPAHRRGGEPHSEHRRPDQSAGPERHHRSGPRRRCRQGLHRRRLGGEGARQLGKPKGRPATSAARSPPSRVSARGRPRDGRDQQHHAADQRDCQHHRGGG